MAYNDAFSVADRYMKECVRYLNDNKKDFPFGKVFFVTKTQMLRSFSTILHSTKASLGRIRAEVH